MWRVEDKDVISLGGISAPWLADQLDHQGVVRLPGVFSQDWLDALRTVVADHIAGHSGGDFLITQSDLEIGSPVERLVSDPALRQLFYDTARLRWPDAEIGRDLKVGIPVRTGTGQRVRSNLFHYDASVLTMVVPVVIPRAVLGSCGELATMGNKRPFRRHVAAHLVDLMWARNVIHRRRVTRKVLEAPEKYIVDLQPGDGYVFWGYRTYHGNLDCAPGLVRATVVLQYGELHSGSRLLKVARTFGGSRRAVRRFHYRPAARLTLVKPVS